MKLHRNIHFTLLLSSLLLIVVVYLPYNHKKSSLHELCDKTDCKRLNVYDLFYLLCLCFLWAALLPGHSSK